MAPPQNMYHPSPQLSKILSFVCIFLRLYQMLNWVTMLDIEVRSQVKLDLRVGSRV